MKSGIVLQDFQVFVERVGNPSPANFSQSPGATENTIPCVTVTVVVFLLKLETIQVGLQGEG